MFEQIAYFFILVCVLASNPAKSVMVDVQPIERDIAYGQIVPFIDEWKNFFKEIKHHDELSPFQLWFRCLDRQVRGYFFIEPLIRLNHDKESYLRNSRYIERNIKMTADGQPIQFRAWNGGGDFFFNISSNVSSTHLVDIVIEGFKHFTRFPVSKCIKPPPILPQRKYIMHIHLKEFVDHRRFEPDIINGIAHHMAYHRCALRLDKYEIVIQGEHLKLYLANPKIAHAVNEGWITFIIRDPVRPSPVVLGNSNCYYQAYTQNMAILQHWQENVKIFFWDSDEYLSTANNLTSSELLLMMEQHTAVAFMRRMIFCDSCPSGIPEAKHWSLTQSQLTLNDHKLRDPKLLVDPNRVGCYIVHWAGCGDKTLRLPVDRVMIVHFENMYHIRWVKGLHEQGEIRARLQFGNESVFEPSPLVSTCDPIKYDWKSVLPSFHPR